MRWRTWALLVLVALLAVVALGPPGLFLDDEPGTPKTAEDVKFANPEPNSSARLWPYTSRAKSFESATLPINMVVQNDATTVRRILVATRTPRGGGELYWNASAQRWQSERPEEESVTINGTGIRWGKSSGAARYTYVVVDGEGRWIDETYQIHDGSYFGTRNHLRLYEGGSGNRTWTAIQAHQEHWDWFQLRHSVDSVSAAQHHVERDLLGSGHVAEIKRERYANGGALDADGWVTVAKLNTLVTWGPDPVSSAVRSPTPTDGRSPLQGGVFWIPLLGVVLSAHVAKEVAAERERLRELIRTSGYTRFHLALFVSTAALPLVVRWGAITAERVFPTASPTMVGGPFYLLLVLGLPAAAAVLGRYLSVSDGFATAVVGFGTGIMADYAYLNITALQYGAVLQRLVLLFGLGLIAADGLRWDEDPIERHRYLLAGSIIWVGTLLWPLLGLG